MPQTPHTERHFTASEVVRDVVIGMSDGLTVPFALAAGLTGGLAGATNPNSIIVTAGLARSRPGRSRWDSVATSLQRAMRNTTPKSVNARSAKSPRFLTKR